MDQTSPPYQVETDRLILRRMTDSDAPIVQSVIEPAIPTLRPWISWTRHENTLEYNQLRIREYESDWKTDKNYCYLALAKDSGQAIGMMGLYGVNRKLRYAHIGYWVTPLAAGKGYATEALNYLFQVGKDDLGLDRIAVLCDDRNEKSAAVAKRAGFTLEGIMRQDWLEEDGTLSNTMVFSKVRGVEF
ncbi:UNVERIFIED_CONTAM: hypothetical protein HDU68_007585 [Siphonaria sp. JEL0065]|nr:hypothetical protein HDU68_007585 [Siphonaria sp. JEL0065]